jgi:hypothetical protein
MNRLQSTASLVSFSLIVSLIGCSSGGPKNADNVVKGIVSVKGEPVGAGSITFHGATSKMAPILSGKYQMDDPPLGQVKVSVKGMGGAEKPKETPGTGDKASGGLLTAGGAGAVAPKKYENPDNGLTYEVKAGKHEKNFELEP